MRIKTACLVFKQTFGSLHILMSEDSHCGRLRGFTLTFVVLYAQKPLRVALAV